MRLLEQLIENRPLWVIGEEATVLDAVNLLTHYNVGALPIVREGRVVGIFSERDVARRVVLHGLDPAQTKIKDVMTKDIIVGKLADGFDRCLEKMRAAKIRHLPVIKDKQLVGFISMRDLFREEIKIQAEEIQHLNDYIHFVPPDPVAKEA